MRVERVDVVHDSERDTWRFFVRVDDGPQFVGILDALHAFEHQPPAAVKARGREAIERWYAETVFGHAIAAWRDLTDAERVRALHIAELPILY